MSFLDGSRHQPCKLVEEFDYDISRQSCRYKGVEFLCCFDLRAAVTSSAYPKWCPVAFQGSGLGPLKLNASALALPQQSSTPRRV